MGHPASAPQHPLPSIRSPAFPRGLDQARLGGPRDGHRRKMIFKTGHVNSWLVVGLNPSEKYDEVNWDD